MQYLADISVDRQILPNQEQVLKNELAKIKDATPPFFIEAEREPESLQYAETLLSALKKGGLKIVLDGKEQDRPKPEDLDSTSFHEVMICVQFRDAPIRPAVMLKSAFDAAGVKSHYVTVDGATDPNTFFIMVAPK